MSTKVTLKDVAERVGKSVSAVSKALSGASDIGPETLAAVQEAAEELGYEPNAAALQLKLQRTDTVGVILPTGSDLRLSDPFFSEFLTGMVEHLEAFDLSVLLSSVSGGDDEAAYLKHIRASRVDGFVVVRTRLGDPRIPVLAGRGIPFVSFGRTGAVERHPYVDEDGEAAMKEVVAHLVELGHRHIACIAEPSGYTKGHNRVRGFLSGMADHGLETSVDAVHVARYRQQSGYEVASEILDQPNPPTAIACCNDLIALGVMKAARERGLTVGRDVSITGFDDIALAAYASPSLTTVRNAAHDSGRIAADIVGRSIRGLHVEEHQVLMNLELVVRGSTGPPRSAGGS